jgi:hypothetical protein
MIVLGEKDSTGHLNYDMNAHRMANSFKRMRHDFEAIKNLREMYARMGLEEKIARRSSGGLGRRVAHLPRPAFVWLTINFPEVLRNKQLLRSFLRSNRQYLMVEKL